MPARLVGRPQWFDRRAVVDSAPIFLPAIPFGFVVGVAMAESAMPTWIAWSSSPLIFAGAAQFAVLTLAGSAGLWAVVVAGVVINTRHLMYGAALAPAFGRQPRWFRWLGPFVLIDQVFALSVFRADLPPEEFRRYYTTCGAFFFLGWQVTTTTGMLVGPVVPASWQLGLAAPVMFVGMVLVAMRRWTQAVSAGSAGLVGVFSGGLPDRLGILVAAAVGVAAGAVAEVVFEAMVDVEVDVVVDVVDDVMVDE
ncbi:MAG: AzlC family ABC transporter permease [Ilumatobacteraceae bacterium]